MAKIIRTGWLATKSDSSSFSVDEAEEVVVSETETNNNKLPVTCLSNDTQSTANNLVGGVWTAVSAIYNS